MIFVSQLSVQHNMTVQNTSRRIRDGFVEIVAIYQDGYNPVMDPTAALPARSNSLGISEYTLGG